jgi:uncharacterized membrane protein
MAANDNVRMAWSWRIFGLGVAALGLIGFVWGDFVSGQPAPRWIPDRAALAYGAAAFMLIAGAAIEWRRTVAWAAAALIAYYGLIVLILENGLVIEKNYAAYGAYYGAAEPLAIMAGALIVFCATADMDAARARLLTRIAQMAFGACAIFFGGAHFVYTNATAPLIPKWLPPSQEFWAYATGLFHIMAGVAVLAGVQARLAAILAAVMYASFIPLVFAPVLMADPANAFRWTECAMTVVLIGVASTVADSLKRASP